LTKNNSKFSSFTLSTIEKKFSFSNLKIVKQALRLRHPMTPQVAMGILGERKSEGCQPLD